jgi:hypothetical protein
MRVQNVEVAQWIPTRLLENMPGQVAKKTIGARHIKDLVANALRLPAENADLIEKDGLRIMGVNSYGGKQPLVSLFLKQVIFLPI